MHELNSSAEPATVESNASSVLASDKLAAEGSTTDGADSSMAPVGAVSDTVADQNARIWFRRGDQLVVGTFVIVVIVLMAVHWVRLSGLGLQPIEIDRLPERRLEFQLTINSATWVEWMQLEGIGETLAHRIVADRETNGPFFSIEDIGRVKGIGPKTIEQMRPWLRVESTDDNIPPSDSPRK